MDWKGLAKASSKFGADSDMNVDGGSWMAQRKAKQQQQEEEIRRQTEKQKQDEEEEKRRRRKSQMEALKVRKMALRIEGLWKSRCSVHSHKNTFVLILVRLPFKTWKNLNPQHPYRVSRLHQLLQDTTSQLRCLYNSIPSKF